jgi:hypothetical protein
MAGLLIIFGLLIFHSKTEFQAAFNHYAVKTYGSTSQNAYAATLAKGTYHGASSLGGLAFGSTLLLIPMIAFFNLWSNWGATLYGEVRGASDFKKNIAAIREAYVIAWKTRYAPDRITAPNRLPAGKTGPNEKM